MDMDMIYSIVAPIVVGVIGYFLKRTFNKLDSLEYEFKRERDRWKENEGKLRGRIDLMNQERQSEIKQLQNETNLKLTHVQEKFDSILYNINSISNDLKIVLQQLAKRGLDSKDGE